MSEQHTHDILHVTEWPGDANVPNGCSIGIDDSFGEEGGRDYYLFTAVHGDPDVLKANARRMVASWNACLHVPVKKLEELAETPDTWIQVTSEVLNKLDGGEITRDLWVISRGEPLRPFWARYSWEQGRHPHGFNDARGVRWLGGEITHIRPYFTPETPATGKDHAHG